MHFPVAAPQVVFGPLFSNFIGTLSKYLYASERVCDAGYIPV